MKPWDLHSGYVRVLAQRNQNSVLVQAANDLLKGDNPAPTMGQYVQKNAAHDFLIDDDFGALPIWDGADQRPAVSIEDRGTKAFSILALEKSKKFLVRAYVSPASLARPGLNDDEPVWLDPDVRGLPALPPANNATGDTDALRQRTFSCAGCSFSTSAPRPTHIRSC